MVAVVDGVGDADGGSVQAVPNGSIYGVRRVYVCV